MKALFTKPRHIVIFLSSILALSCMAGCTSSIANKAATSATTTTTLSDSNYLATVKIGTTPGRAISPTFMGLSHEWGVQTQMGSEATGVDYIYRQLLKNLMAYGSGPLIIRIGGNSTDTSGEPTATTAVPFAELATALGVHFYLGVNLGANNVNLAMDQAKTYVAQMPAEYLDGIEIGNEPDLYYKNGLRPASYSFQNYLADFNAWKTNIAPLLPSGTLLMGASWSGIGALPNIQNYESNELQSLATFSLHEYAGSSKKLTQENILLTPAMATAGLVSIASAVTETHNNRLPFRLGEIGAFYDSTGVSVNNTFESALWAIDVMFEYANIGVDGVNWHGNPSATNAYGSFAIATKANQGATSYSLISVRPLYYGLLLFQEATANNAHLLPVTLSTNANLKAWGTIDASQTPRLVVINKDENASGIVLVTPPTGFAHAKIAILAAPSYLSTIGVALGGQTFDGSKDGTIQGAQSMTSVGLVNGVFQVSISATSAALVTFSK